jgi:hypothetical protein
MLKAFQVRGRGQMLELTQSYRIDTLPATKLGKSVE